MSLAGKKQEKGLKCGLTLVSDLVTLHWHRHTAQGTGELRPGGSNVLLLKLGKRSGGSESRFIGFAKDKMNFTFQFMKDEKITKDPLRHPTKNSSGKITTLQCIVMQC